MKTEQSIKSLIKSHKEIKESISSRFSQARSRIEEIERDTIYSTSLPSLDYSKPHISQVGSVNDTTFKSLVALEQNREKMNIYKEMQRLRSQMDEVNEIFDIYRALQTHIPLHYEVTNKLYYICESYEYCETFFQKTSHTLKDIAETTIKIISKFFNDGYKAKDIDNMSQEDFAKYIGEDLYKKIINRECKEKN